MINHIRRDDYIFDLDSEKWKEVYKKHLEKYGFDKQLTVLIEESGELVKAICKIIRSRENDKNYNDDEVYNLHEETIDCLIMTMQFKKMYLDYEVIEAIFSSFEYRELGYVISHIELLLLKWLGKLIYVSSKIKLTNEIHIYSKYEFHEAIIYVWFLLEIFKDNKLDFHKIREIKINKYKRACKRVDIEP